MKTAPSASVEEKRRMMDLLKRFEEDALDDSPLLEDSDNDEDADGLSQRLENVDLGDCVLLILGVYRILR